jgi:hypothetical protein
MAELILYRSTRACEYIGTSSGDALPYSSTAFFNLTACPTSWASYPYFDGRFILATPAQGKSGSSTTLAWSTYRDPGHSHAYSGSVSVTAKGFVWGGGFNHIAAPGNQPVSGSLSTNTSPVVPFVTLLVCQKGQMGTNQALPLGLTMFFSASTCPRLWGTTPAAPGRFFVGMAEGGTQGASFGGDPMQPNETTRSHDHYVNGSIEITEYDTDLTQTWSNLYLGQKGAANYTVLSTPASVELPYVMLEACTYTGVSTF